MEDWPFDQPPDCAVITLRQITHHGEPILHVTHDEDDHGWQFLGWGHARVEDGVVVSLAHFLEMDPSVRAVANLPPGWHGWRRAVGEPWTREVYPQTDQDA
jgi:hypothetical protein